MSYRQELAICSNLFHEIPFFFSLHTDYVLFDRHSSLFIKNPCTTVYCAGVSSDFLVIR